MNETYWTLLFLLFYIVPALMINNGILIFFILSLLCLTLFLYLKHKTFGTMWCWTTNLLLGYFLIDIIMIQPYLNHLC